MSIEERQDFPTYQDSDSIEYPEDEKKVSDFIRQLVIPVLNPIRRHLPVPAGLDFSPLIAIILIQSFSLLINENITAKILLNGIVCTNFQHLV